MRTSRGGMKGQLSRTIYSHFDCECFPLTEHCPQYPLEGWEGMWSKWGMERSLTLGAAQITSLQEGLLWRGEVYLKSYVIWTITFCCLCKSACLSCCLILLKCKDNLKNLQCLPHVASNPGWGI